MDANGLPQDPAQAPRQGVGKFAVLGALLLGAIIGGVIVEYWLVTRGVETPRAQTDARPAPAIWPLTSHT